MVFQRRTIHTMSDRSIRLMPMAEEREGSLLKMLVLFVVCAVLAAALVSL